MLVGAEELDQRDQHDGHRHQKDHPDGKKDLPLHRHVPRRSGNKLTRFDLINFKLSNGPTFSCATT